MTRSLESRYRRLIVWYPRSWRQSQGNALLGILLDIAESEHRDKPRLRERFSIAGHGVEARMERIAPSDIRNAAATISFSMGAGFALVTFLVSSWAPWGNELFPAAFYSKLGPFYDAGPALTIFWVIALACLICGKWQAGRLALLLSVLVAVGMPFVTAALHPQMLGVDPTSRVFFAVSALVAMFGTPRRNALAGGITVASAVLVWVGYSWGQPFQLPVAQAGDVIWNHHIVDVWYGCVVVLAVCIGMAITKRWAQAFTLVLALVPISTVLIAYATQSRLFDQFAALTVVVSETIGLTVLMLWSTGRLTLPPRDPQQDRPRASSPLQSANASLTDRPNIALTTVEPQSNRLSARAATRSAAATIAALAVAALVSALVFPASVSAGTASSLSSSTAPTASEFAPIPSVPRLHPGQKIDIEPDQNAWELELQLLATEHHASSIAVDTTTGRILSVTDLGSDTSNLSTRNSFFAIPDQQVSLPENNVRNDTLIPFVSVQYL